MDVKIFLIPRREHPPTIKAKEASSTGKHVAHFSRTHLASTPKKVSELSTWKRVLVTFDYRIPGIPHSTVKKEDSNHKDIVKRLIQQFENHPNRESLMEDLNKAEEFIPFSEKSKELITSMGNTEYFELCEMSSTIQCLDCSLYWEVGIVNCTCGTSVQPPERNRQLNKA